MSLKKQIIRYVMPEFGMICIVYKDKTYSVIDHGNTGQLENVTDDQINSMIDGVVPAGWEFDRKENDDYYQEFYS